MADGGNYMYRLAEELFPICRSLTGDGVRETLRILKRECDCLKIYEIPTGTKVFDWVVPKEWNIREAYIETETGERIIDFHTNNLHAAGYSLPMDAWMSGREAMDYIYTLPDQPDAVPYVTAYYAEKSGFCMTEAKRRELDPEGRYHLFIDSTLKEGSLTYGEILLPGEREEEIFISTYICHPGMANNEVSGPCVAIALARWLQGLAHRRYSFRFIWIPENIGAIAYLSRNLKAMKEKVIAGFNLSCVGDNRAYSHIASVRGDTLADRALHNALFFQDPGYYKYPFKASGSDERRYNAPGVELPVCGFSRSKYWEYPEYHTSLDNMSLISEEGLEGSLTVMKRCITNIACNDFFRILSICEPQLGKRGLYPQVSIRGANSVQAMMDFIAYADGTRDLIEISDIIGVEVSLLTAYADQLMEHNLMDRTTEPFRAEKELKDEKESY